MPTKEKKDKMTLEAELNKFRKQEAFRLKRRHIPRIVIGGFLTIAVVAFGYGYYQQLDASKHAAAIRSQLQDLQNAQRKFEEKTARFAEMAKYQAEKAERITAECLQQNPKSK